MVLITSVWKFRHPVLTARYGMCGILNVLRVALLTLRSKLRLVQRVLVWRKFRGTLEQILPAEGAEGVTGWQIVWSDAPPPKPGQRVSKKRVPPPLQALGFALDELREARLAPIVSFKGRDAGASMDEMEE